MSAKTLVILVAITSSQLFPERTNSVRLNPSLHAFFWEQALRSTSTFDHYGRRVTPHHGFLEQYIDRLANHYLGQIDEDLLELRENYAQAQEIRMKILNGALGRQQRRELLVRWKSLMGKLADQANDLRKTLSLPFFELPSKEEFSRQITEKADIHAFEREMQFIGEQVARAEGQINDYLFAPTHTITVASLSNGENMLIHLYRVHKMAQLLEKRIPV